MRALLVQGNSPPAYWSFGHSLPFIGKDATHPPLGLATMAAHLPATLDLRLRDLHLGPVSDDELRDADAILVSGMLVEADSVREILSRVRVLGRVTVVGGPAATTSPESFPQARHVFRGEAEAAWSGSSRCSSTPRPAWSACSRPPTATHGRAWRSRAYPGSICWRRTAKTSRPARVRTSTARARGPSACSASSASSPACPGRKTRGPRRRR